MNQQVDDVQLRRRLLTQVINFGCDKTTFFYRLYEHRFLPISSSLCQDTILLLKLLFYGYKEESEIDLA